MARRAHHEQPATRRVLAQLELLINQRLAGAVHGDYQGFFPGPGNEAGEGRPYVPGDDVRMIDWNLTARTLHTHVRDPIRDHELDVWIVVDLSASQSFGTRGGEKRELALFATAAFGFAATWLANRVGAVLLVDGETEVWPLRSGKTHLQAVLHRIATINTREPRPDPPGGRTDLSPALSQVGTVAPRRGFVAVISDFLVEPGWANDLHRLSQRHTVVAVELVDPLELRLPAVGSLVVEDPETGARLTVDTLDSALRERYEEAARHQRERIAHIIRNAGAEHLRLRTDEDWIGQLVQFFRLRKHRQTGYRRSSWVG
ncbi:DUF58 domain-containing protein [Saccharopolyspora rhizosphaerae]|uniref:DUF58 domain-containing protein n=1 Tax=Saccharopolyspora rhizosphaerae TaxID=2492662 RepID=A0A426K5I9_9PSEU|nr:DUF58 domain-containing protein [Saccharopolyspora rhizosphaerae]RRO20679.1 DUF58 domain-containing protein [Saccharopolyspora rhizosphaerae]